MPLVPAHLKRKLAKKGKADASEVIKDGGNTGGAESLGIMNTGASSLINEIQEGPTEEIKEESGVKLAVAAVAENANIISLNKDGMIPAGADATSRRVPPPETAAELAPPPVPLSSSESAKKLVSKRTLLYPMHGVSAYENNDGMRVSDEAGAGEGKGTPAASVDFDTLQSRNVSLAKGLNADQSLNDLMGGVMIDIISQNGQDTAKSLDEAVRKFNSKTGAGGHGGATKKSGGAHQGQGKGKKQSAVPSDQASATLKSLLGVKAQASSAAAVSNGGLNVIDMLKGAKKSAAGKKSGGSTSGSTNWQQEQLLQAQATTNPYHQSVAESAQGGKPGKAKGGGAAYAKEQTKKLNKFLKETDGGKDVNYASSAVFNAPDASEIPLPDFAADMASATFAKGGFFDT